MKIGLIGKGAIANYVSAALEKRGHSVGAILLRPERVMENPALYVGAVQDLPNDLDLMIDCAGHSALIAYGADILLRGLDLITVSVGALADQQLYDHLKSAALQSNAKMHIASGAIGALDCLQSARVGRLDSVTYVGRKPPNGWRGSPAEQVLDLDALTGGAKMHFQGTARAAALAYPKNANVAAAVALAGIGFDDTQVQLIADADVTENIHEIEAAGEFGSFRFQISGQSLPDNPRSSALAAMSVLSKVEQISQPISL
jgi:aspartate dehydrogenase|tara:strand:- start:8456 stop:9232 length:777 start_codon:yes stop_codon:yes gene_type:complete